ncbi:MAG: response regulator [Magnetococcales bacterium]|nr:response regulator [Magnetococcales bacterium]
MTGLQPKILVIDDESAIRDTVRLILTTAGLTALEAATVHEAQKLMRRIEPSLILLDWMLPGISGLEYLRMLKSDITTREIPVILLTVRSDEGDKVTGLELGADDYITKPFSARELLARIKVALRRLDPSGTAMAEVVSYDVLVLNRAYHSIAIGDQPLKLSPMEYRLLGFFITHPDRMYQRDQLLDLVWGRNVYVGDRTVDVHIRQIRKALEPFGKDGLLQTVRSAGYLFSTRKQS